MALSFKKNKNTDILESGKFELIRQAFLLQSDDSVYDKRFSQLIQWLKGGKLEEDMTVRIEHLMKVLREDVAFLKAVRDMVLRFFNQKSFISLFTDIGVLSSSSFISEIKKSITNKILPSLPDRGSMKYLLKTSFSQSNDYKKVNAVSNEHWEELFELIISDVDLKDSNIFEDILESLSVLSFRALSFSYSDDISSKWRASPEKYNSMLLQNQEINWLIHMYQEGRFDESAVESQIEKIHETLDSCLNLLLDIKSNSVFYGTSLEQSYSIARAEQQMRRLKSLLDMLKGNSTQEKVLGVVVKIFKKTVEFINKEEKVFYIISQSTGLLAYQVSEHKRETGEHYITKSRSEYWELLISSIKGGLIICVAAFIKILLHYLHLAPFWTYFFYGLNYALAFCILYLTHSTLATKQPAMTAAAMAYAIDHKNQDYSGRHVSILLARVWRSQFISFVGNLIIVFPICMAIAMAYNFIAFEHLMRPYEYAENGLMSQHPFTSLAWLYACFTGVFLFLSGIISGYVDNKVIFGNIPARILAHPTLNRSFSKQSIDRISVFVRNHLGSLVGNIFLGFALGFAPYFGEFFGIPFDIRHITISTAYLGFGIIGTEFELPISDILLIALGVIGIGVFNFTISFGLAFITAMSSRNVPMKNTKFYFKSIKKHLRKYPLDFIFPPKRPRTPEDLLK